jgi:signal transduction histidine kinase
LHTRAIYSGSGIGLALCRKIVSNHFGSIYAEGQEGLGATFHVLLPSQQQNINNEQNLLYSAVSKESGEF